VNVVAGRDGESAVPAAPVAPVGAVVIGRNEGERLRRCLASLVGVAAPIIYVDSGSTDGSVALARAQGAVVVELDTALPFTAARARNAGLATLRELEPGVRFVQFIDGDCELVPGWLEQALAKLLADPGVAVVCGRRRERFPDATLYNRLCDMEWNTPVGETAACGGDALVSTQALHEVNGYNVNLIAGEEPDLCLRLRQRGHRIWRLDTDMTLHDANITRFGQWLRRTLRSGHAYAEGFTLHRQEPGRYYRKQVRSNLFWGAALPAAVLLLALPTRGVSVLLLGGYSVLGVRVARSLRRQGVASNHARLYALFCVLGKVPSAYGQLRYWLGRALGKRSAIIEYKRASP
jgi:glycosyltransferase involved in cell wall biosynthesis